MASTQVTFDEVKTFYEGLFTIRRQVWPFYEGHFNVRRQVWPMTDSAGYVAFMEMNMKFEDVVRIESKRREIENLQNRLNDAATAKFARVQVGNRGVAIIDDANPVPDDAQGVLREAHCKWLVLQIIKLLDECERMGVEVVQSKQVLLQFLEEIKPKAPGDVQEGCLY